MAKTAATNPVERGICYWMERVVMEREKVRVNFDADAVHDLRVALRRCRSMAEGFQTVDGDRIWKKMRKSAKVIFSALGDLRDAQVQLEWIGRLGSSCPSVAERLSTHCRTRETELKTNAAEVVEKFNTQLWLQWAHRLDERVRGLGDSIEVFRVLALERYSSARNFHAKALRNRSKASVHELRIAIKRLRYIVENFLPEQRHSWGNDLKRIQDLLGEVHDLDILYSTAREIHAFASPDERQRWNAAVSLERAQRVQAYRDKMVGRHSLWQEWRNGLPAGDQLRRAVLKRFNLWAKSLDSDPAHTQSVTKFSLELYDALQLGGLSKARSAGVVSARDLLQVAALTHRLGHNKTRHKASSGLLTQMEAPPGWSATDLLIAELVARYHRGAPPTNDERYAVLSFEARHMVDCLGGILRLADSLDSQHDHAIRGIVVSKVEGRIDIIADGYIPNSKQAEKIAAARHVLEHALNTALLVREPGVAADNQMSTVLSAS